MSVGRATEAAHMLHLGMQNSSYCGHRWDGEPPGDDEIKPWICENAKSEPGVKRAICIVTVRINVFVRMLS